MSVLSVDQTSITILQSISSFNVYNHYEYYGFKMRTRASLYEGPSVRPSLRNARKTETFEAPKVYRTMKGHVVGSIEGRSVGLSAYQSVYLLAHLSNDYARVRIVVTRGTGFYLVKDSAKTI